MPLTCSNCGAALVAHCRLHTIPCCPGKCLTLDELLVLGRLAGYSQTEAAQMILRAAKEKAK